MHTCILGAGRELEVWGNVLVFNGASVEQIDKTLVALGKAVSVLSERQIKVLIESAGFERPLRIFQTSLLHAWFARAREPSTPQGTG